MSPDAGQLRIKRRWGFARETALRGKEAKTQDLIKSPRNTKTEEGASVVDVGPGAIR